MSHSWATKTAWTERVNRGTTCFHFGVHVSRLEEPRLRRPRLIFPMHTVLSKNRPAASMLSMWTHVAVQQHSRHAPLRQPVWTGCQANCCILGLYRWHPEGYKALCVEMHKPNLGFCTSFERIWKPEELASFFSINHHTIPTPNKGLMHLKQIAGT